MNRRYWESVAENYSDEVLSVFESDTKGLVCERISAGGKAYPNGRAADLGCGVGMFTSSLAAAFGRVEACDISEACLELARKGCENCSGITFRRMDLAADPVPFEPVDFALCVNVLIMPILDERMRAWRAVTNQVTSGGTLLLVAPSLESVQLELFRSVDTRLGDGDSCDDALKGSLPLDTTVGELQQGVHRLLGLPTKHYLKEELEDLLKSHEFLVKDVRKIEYEFADVSAGVECWDWLIVAERK